MTLTSSPCRLKRLTFYYTLAILSVLAIIIITLKSGGHYGSTINKYLLSGQVDTTDNQLNSDKREYKFGTNSTTSLVVRPGQHRLYWDRVNSMSDASVSVLHRDNAILEITADCPIADRLHQSNKADNDAWNLCLLGPFTPQTPCFVVSFAKQTNWKFETHLAMQFKCQVFAFDPTMAPSGREDNGKIVYLREGLHNAMASESWFTETYLGHLKRLKADNLVIDILKLDIGDAALQALEVAVKDESLNKVKQLLLSVPIHTNISMEQMRSEIKIVATLHQIGFRLWYQSVAPVVTNSKVSPTTDYKFCRQLHFINAKFASGSQTSRNPAGSELNDPIKLLPIVKVPGFDKLSEIKSKSLSGTLSKKEMEALYYQLLEQQHLHCPNSKRVGDGDDGGWDVCFSDPVDITKAQPCVAFSFGINNIFNYDDKLAEKYNCNVYMFDPSMSSNDYQRKKTSWFYRTGLSSNNTVASNGWKMRTLCTLFKELGYADKQIDILKIDIEYWEWVSFEKALEEGCLKRVKQLMFETHTNAMFMAESNYGRFIKILMDIFELGFRTWNMHLNVYSRYHNTTGIVRPCCYEHYMINTNLLHL